MMKEPEINVGIVNAQEIHFSLNGRFFAKGETVCGEQSVSFSEGGILWNGNLYRELTFTPQDERTSFSLYDVTIGINFHWERQETQSFMGTLKLVVDEGKITAINILPVEDYLISVISSEMNATSSLEFLKAHAVVSRSWLFAQMEKRKALCNKNEGFFSFVKTENEYIRWYDREDHTIFDVCADDHCQRYQGITKASNATVAEAVRATRGQLLMYGQGICDARFSKCCGGVTEEFGYCWEDKDYPYLSAIRDDGKEASQPLPRPDSGSGSRTLDTHLSPGILQHRRQENHFTDTEQLRPRNDKLLSLESALHTRGTGRAHPTEHQNRLRKHPRFNSCPARKVGTYLQTKNRRHPEDPHYRKGTGNSPHPLLLPSVQFGFCHRQRRAERRCAGMVPADRRRLGSRSRLMPNRCRCHG